MQKKGDRAKSVVLVPKPIAGSFVEKQSKVIIVDEETCSGIVLRRKPGRSKNATSQPCLQQGRN